MGGLKGSEEGIRGEGEAWGKRGGLDKVIGVLVIVVQDAVKSLFSPLSAWKRFVLKWSPQAGLIILAVELCCRRDSCNYS